MNRVMNETVTPSVLVILDGWGFRQNTQGNAIAIAKTPVVDHLEAMYPNTLLQASGKAVGLPEGQMGNSEVGHLNIGAGRIVPQELVRISDAVKDGSLLRNPALTGVYQATRKNGSKLHLIGLCSDGGVHSHIEHLFGLLDLAVIQGVSKVCIHVLTDGRDTQPTQGKEAVQQIQHYIERVGTGQIVTISGRYYGMDRDQRWDRTQRTYTVMTQDGPGDDRSAIEVLEDAYAQDITDEFIPPTRVATGAVEAGDSFVFFNFRPDRARQLTQAFVDFDFKGFKRQQILPLYGVTFTQYEPKLPVSLAFKPQSFNHTLGQVIAEYGLKQFRIAETEKYAHVTYFSNGGAEEPFIGEDRALIPSPKVPTYDLTPEMSAGQVTARAIAAIEQQIYSFILINYANPDMIGHTGKMDKTVQAVETVDRCLEQLLEKIEALGGTLIVTADHGNAECMNDAKGKPYTAHTNNPVPFILVRKGMGKNEGHGSNSLRSGGCLADIAPTILEILGIPQPSEMSGQSLLTSVAPVVNSNPVLAQKV